MAKLGELASPVMRSTTRLQRYPAPGMGCKEVQKLSSTDPLAKYRSTPLTMITSDTNASLKVVLNTSTLAHVAELTLLSVVSLRPPHYAVRGSGEPI